MVTHEFTISETIVFLRDNEFIKNSYYEKLEYKFRKGLFKAVIESLRNYGFKIKVRAILWSNVAMDTRLTIELSDKPKKSTYKSIW